MSDPWAGFQRAGQPGEQEVSAAPKGWEGFQTAAPTAADKRGAIAKGAAGGLIEGGMSTAGMIGGGIAGSALGPMGTAAGAALGGAAGFQAGRIYRGLTPMSTRDTPDALKPYEAAGETFGASLPFGGGAVALGKMGATLPKTMVGNFINRVIETAGRSPAPFMAVEASAAASSGVGAGIVVAHTDNPFARVAGEVIGGMASPANLVALASRYGMRGFGMVAARFSKDGKKTAASKLLNELLKESGEDPTTLAALLRDPAVPVNLTAAQKTGSPALAAMEATLRNRNIKFGVESDKLLTDGLDAMEGMIGLLRRTGEPAALTHAAQIRQRQFRSMLQGMVKGAESDAIEAARRITSDTPAARGAISSQARNSLEFVLDQARAAETELWQKIPRDTPAYGGAVVNAYRSARGDLLPNEQLPAVIEGFIEDLMQAGQNTNVGDLLRARSRFLQLARQSASGANPNWNEARIYGQLADAALEDLGHARLTGLPPFLVDDAREFSKALNETFSIGFTQRALGRTPTAGERMPPELVLRRALATGSEAAELQFRELDDATRFLSRHGIDSPQAQAAVDQMQEAQERFLRLTAANSIDPTTGRVSAKRLADNLNNQEALFNRFPEAREAVKAALRSEARLADIERLAKNASRAVDQRAAFSKITNVENPVDAVSRALNGSNPVSDLKAFAKFAREAGPSAREGLRSTAIDYLMAQGEGLNPKRMRKALLDPIRTGKPSFADIMKEAGILNDADINRITQIIDQAEKAIGSSVARADLLSSAEASDPITDLIVRVQGAKLGGALSGAGPMKAHSLIAAQAGSQAVRKLLAKMTTETMESILVEAAKDPALMAMLIETPSTAAAAMAQSRQLHAYLLQAGFRLTTMGDDDFSDLFSGTDSSDGSEQVTGQPPIAAQSPPSESLPE